jgi:hypothetical protein
MQSMGLSPSKFSEDQLVELLWGLDETKRLKRSIEANSGLIEAIIVSGKDGTVFEGNSRLTCYQVLRKEDPDNPAWTHVRARILPPDVTRDSVDVLLGEIHFAGKNEWSPFEQATHLYKMNLKGHTQERLAEMFRMSKGYVGAKLRAYKLMAEHFVPMAHEQKKDIKDPANQWSWFEEFYKTCKPSLVGKENPDRIYDGEELEEKFCEWVLDDKLPKAEDVRKLRWLLEDRKAMKALESDGIEKAFGIVAAKKPAVASKLWKTIDQVTAFLNEMPYNEIEAIRDGDIAKISSFDSLVKAVDRIKKELKK